MGRAFAVARPSSAALRALNYTPEVERIRARARLEGSRSLGDLADVIGPAYGTAFKRIDCDQHCGVALLSQSEMFAAEPTGRSIRLDSMPHPERHKVHRYQILIAGAGTLGANELYGRSVIADGRLADRYLSQDACSLQFAEAGGDINLFVYAFLCTASGIRALRSTSYGTKILRFRRELLNNIPIPLPGPAKRRRVADLVRRTVKARERYAEELRAARVVVEALPEMKEALAMCEERRGRCVSWSEGLPTLSAWTYASTGGALGYLKQKWQGRVDDVVEPDGLFNGPRFARVSCRPPHGIDFLSQRDVFLVKPVPRRIKHPGFGDRLLFVPSGSLLVGGHGTLGEGEIFAKVVYVSDDLSRSACTQDLLRVQPRRAYSAIAYSFLSTTVGFRLLRSTAVGTKILSMREDLLRSLPFPELGEIDLRKIAHHIQNAMAARVESAGAEAEAVRIVEEEVLPAWLA